VEFFFWLGIQKQVIVDGWMDGWLKTLLIKIIFDIKKQTENFE
jgi:hypothetical protein